MNTFVVFIFNEFEKKHILKKKSLDFQGFLL